MVAKKKEERQKDDDELRVARKVSSLWKPWSLPKHVFFRISWRIQR